MTLILPMISSGYIAVSEADLALTFYESAYGTSIGTTDVYVVDTSGNIIGSSVYSSSGDTGTPNWVLATASARVVSDTFRIAWHVVKQAGFLADYAVDTVTLQGVSYNFDSNNNGFLTTINTNTTSSTTALSGAVSVPNRSFPQLGRWGRHSGSTPSSPTGPTSAQSGSFHLYTESSLSEYDDVVNFWLFSPEITA